MKSKMRKQKVSALVNNETLETPPAVSKKQNFESVRVTMNAAKNLIRKETVAGVEYTVVPCVMMTEGVHRGSRGPLYYSKDALSGNIDIWNTKPVVVYHPTRNGEGISACSPAVIESSGIGMLMNARCTKLGQLKAEAYINEARCKVVDNRVWEAIEAGEMMELSTGVFTDNEMEEGEWNGEEYVGIATNLRADHLAILPDQKGACAIKDGAGFIRNQLFATFSELDSEDVEVIQDRIVKILTNEKKKKGAIGKLLVNEASFEQIREMLCLAIRKKYPEDEGYAYPWVEAVYEGTFIYCIGGKLFKMGYSNMDSTVKLVGEPSQVVRVTEYKDAPVSNKLSASINHNNDSENIMDKSKIVNDLIGNLGYAESDRAELMGLKDDALQATYNAAKKLKGSPAAKTVDNAAAAVVVAPAKIVTVDDYINNAPEGLRDVLRSGLTAHASQKEAYIKAITANKANVFTPEYLQTQSLDQLKGIAALAGASVTANSSAPKAVQTFIGNGGTAPEASAPTDNGVNDPFCVEGNAIGYQGMKFDLPGSK